MATTSSPERQDGFFRELVAQEQRASVVRRGVIYARYSTEIQDTSDSIEVQIAECRRYAVEHSITLVREPYIDHAETGTSTENRHAYQRLLAVAQNAERDFEVILTFHTSRWGRGIESEIDEYRLQAYGIRIIAVSQPFTADEGVESVFMKGVLRKIDAYYSMQASKYTHAYQTSNAQHGFKNGGTAPDGYIIEQVPTGKKDKYGVEKTKARLALDERPGRFDMTKQPRYKLIEFAFTHAQGGRGPKWLAKAIRAEGWRNRYRPEPISHITIRSWLANPLYTGYMVWNRVRFYRKNGRRTYTSNPISKWVSSPAPAHPAIISRDIFESVGIRYVNRNHLSAGRAPGLAPVDSAAKPDNRGHYLLSGLLLCGSCGAHYVAARNLHTGKKTHVYYVCNTKWRRGPKDCASLNINLAVAEGSTLEALLNTVLTEGEIQRFIEAFNEFLRNRSANVRSTVTRVTHESEQIRLEIGRIKQAILAGAEPAALAEDLNDRYQRLSACERERSSISESTDAGTITYDPRRFNMWLDMLKRNFRSMDFETRRELIRQFISRIDVQPDRSALLKWNPEAILRLADGLRVPQTATMVMKERCGGMQQPDPHFPLPIVILNLKVAGKSRWPFGREILRELGGPAD